MTAALPGVSRARHRLELDRLVAAAALLGAGVVAFALASTMLLPDVGLWDTAEYQTALPLLGTLHPTGFPAYAVLGWLASLVLAPFGSPAFRVDLLSAALLGVAVAGTGWLALLLTGRLSLGLVAGLGLAVTPIAWRIGTRADAHALHLAIVPFLLVALVLWERRRRAVDREGEGVGADRGAVVGADRGVVPDPAADRLLLAASALFGLALADHRLVALFVPGIVAFVLVVEPGIVRRRRFIAACLALVLLVAGALYLELPLRAGPFRAPLVYADPETFTGFWYVVLGVQFGGTLVSSLTDPVRELASLVSLTVEQLGILAAALPAAVLVTCVQRPRYALLSLPAALITCVFAAGYTDADIGRYYLGPALLAWTWLAVAAGWLLDLLPSERRWGEVRVCIGSGPAVRPPGRAATVLVVAAFAAAVVPTLPARADGVRADVRGASGRAWLDAALETMAPDSIVVSWWSYSTPLWYAQLIEGRRLDVRVVDDRTRLDEGLGDAFAVIDANIGRRTVYAIRVDELEIARMERRYDIVVLPLPDGPGLVRIDRIRDPAA